MRVSPISKAGRPSAMASASVLPRPSPRRLFPPQPRPATLTRSPVWPSMTYSINVSLYSEKSNCHLTAASRHAGQELHDARVIRVRPLTVTETEIDQHLR